MSDKQDAQPGCCVVALPDHKCGLFLTHNEHRNFYDKLDQFIFDNNLVDDFESLQAMQQAIDTDECWILQWYPDTPVGFYRIASPTLEGVLALAALRITEKENS